MADRHAFLGFDNRVIFLDPFCRLFGLEKGECKRTQSLAGGEMDRLAARAGDPHWRVRFLHRLRHQIAARHLEPAPGETGIGPHRQHVGGLLGRLFPHRPLVVRLNAKPAHLDGCRRLAGTPFDPPVRDKVEGRDTLGDPRRMIVMGRHQGDAVAEANVCRALRARGEKHLGGGGMRVFLEKMVLDLPDIIDAKAVGEFDLFERIAVEPLFGVVFPRLR